MKKSEWSDKQLEDLLRQMPKIQDDRDPRDIYRNLPIKKHKTKQWLLPSIATVTAFLLLFILVPRVMDGTYLLDNASEEEFSEDKEVSFSENNNDSSIALKKEDTSLKESSIQDTKKTENKELMGTESSIKTAIYEDEVGNGKVLTYWIPDRQGQILIPVSTLVSDSKDQSWLPLYTETMANLTETAWGLSDYYPLDVTLNEKSDTLMVDVPTNHQYGQGSAAERNFIQVLQKDITSNSSNLNKIKFSTNGVPGIELGNYGRMENLDLVQEKNQAFFIYYSEGNDFPFLAPSSETYQDITTAIAAMKNDQPVLGLKKSIPSSLLIQNVSIKGKTLDVTIKDNSSLKDDQLTLASYEALLLTAKEFGLEKVFVKNSPLPNLGPFDLSKENKVPISPNLRTIQ
ncbi:MAG: hypothetical protein K6T88_05940 [Bacillus sp. (in: Bacteria)]|nr:hypothetical protein [Bacillus sp. (in: firmicutes)]